MARQPADILAGAFSLSKEIFPDVTIDVDASDEGLEIVNRAVRGAISAGIGVRPEYFGVKAPVTGVASVWTIPAACECLYYLDKAGTPVWVVDVDNQDAGDGENSVFLLGQTLQNAANSLLGATDSIDFYYSSEGTEAATLTSPIDSRFPDRFDRLLHAEVVVRILIKDHRQQDAAFVVETERDPELALWSAFLAHYVLATRRTYKRRFGRHVLRKHLLASPTGT
jgi:hypothetical protein